jgi:hypothetical protein
MRWLLIGVIHTGEEGGRRRLRDRRYLRIGVHFLCSFAQDSNHSCSGVNELCGMIVELA